MSKPVSGKGITLVELVGALLAAYCSWTINHSIFWCAIHAIFGWLYLFYLCTGISGQTLPVDFY